MHLLTLALILTALRPASSAVVWTQTDGYKVLPQATPAPAARAAAISGARGETVSFQIVVSAVAAPLASVNVSMSDLRDSQGHTIASAKNVELFREFYVLLKQPSPPAGFTGWVPDGLIPIGYDPYYHELRNGAPFDVARARNQAVWADVAIPANTVAGTYRGAATVTSGTATVATVPVTLTVWNFTLPATATLATAFGLDTWQTYQGHYGGTWSTPKIETLTDLYQAEALKHRMSLYDNDVAGPQYAYDAKTHSLSYIDYTLFDSTMRPDLAGTPTSGGGRATVAEVPDGNPNPPGPAAGPNDEEYVVYWKAVAAHFRQQNWFSRNFYYDLDEPSTPQDYATVKHRADVIHQADSGFRVMDTTSYRPDLVGKIDIWDPIVNELDSPGYPSPSIYAQRQRAGDNVWFYDSDSSTSSDGPWPNFFLDRGANDARIFPWMAWRYRLDGFLYYATTQTYTEYPNPWTNVWSYGDNGDGILFYPGRVALIGGKHDIPCASIRMKLIRAGMQDYEYMALLHAKGQDAFLNAVVAGVVAKTNRWTHDPSVLARARAAMAAKILGQ
ncbi:MAG: DUF4091 domain-containing protein [Candidatus Eremiobacteraeota bacterium]|nr:DUF4091 domain-containing protein [Candidatus Eremiobacteraeota bacterium]